MSARQRVYLDHAATSPLRPEARSAITDAFGVIGNPSSVHTEGRAARALIERARHSILAALGGARAGRLIFTSGATEANAHVLRGVLERSAASTVLASAVEHSSILAQPAVEMLPVDRHGRLDLERLQARLHAGDAAVLALMLANNETGVIQPVAEAAALARDAGVWVHVDAVQALGRLSIDVDELRCDSVALSAHKLGGPAGVGALWLRDEQHVAPLINGGGQESRQRGGTENVLGINGFRAALEAQQEEDSGRIATLRSRLEQGALAVASDAVIIGAEAERVPHITALALPATAAATQVMALDLDGIAVSAGAACSSGKVGASHVLAAMGIDPALAKSTIRVSLGWNTTDADIDHFLKSWSTLARRRSATAA